MARDLQGFWVVGILLTGLGHIGEDGVGLGQPFQGLGLLDASASVAHAVEDVTQGPLAGQAVAAVAIAVLQLLSQFPGRQVGVASGGL